ncbi:transposase [Xylella taiwanensis]|nr:transposase [Xylella taiwanensis]
MVEHCLPRQHRNVSPKHLQVLNAIVYLTEYGCQWHHLPKRFGH